MSTTEATRRDMMKQVKKNELEQILRSFDGVTDAQVIIDTAPETGFLRQSDESSTVAVFLKTSKDITNTTSETMARLIQRSIRGLLRENISITNEQGETLFDGLDSSDGQGITDVLEYRRMLSRDITNSIKQLLSPVYDDIEVTPNLVFDMDKVSDHYIEHTPTVEDAGFISEESIHTEEYTETQQAGEPGLGTNNAQATTYNLEEGAAGTGSINDRQRTYIYNTLERVRESGVAQVLRDESSMAVSVYTYQPYYEDTITAETLGGLTWSQFKDANGRATRFDVDAVEVEMFRAASGIENVSVSGYNKAIFYDTVVTPLNIREIALFGLLALFILMLAYGLIKKNEPSEVVEIEPELSVEDLLVSTQLDEQQAEEADRLQDIDFSKESEFKTQIEKIIGERPEAVVQLLRTWINEKEWE
jgi:flagellar M-ring protein FliF